MKNLIALFAFVLIAATAQSQSFTDGDITGAWRIVNIENNSVNPKMAATMTNAWLIFDTNKSFELKEKQSDTPTSQYKTTSNKNAAWSYNQSTKTITISRTKMNFKVSESNGKIYFTDNDSGLKLEVIRPI